MIKNISEIKNCIDINGKLISTDEEVQNCFRAAELLCESLLGATLKVRGQKFFIRMLEIYYGSAADVSHDWYRNRFVYKKSKLVRHTNIQAERGFKIYINSLDTKDTYSRMDIVVGEENVAISFLLRSVWDENFKIVGNRNGQPNVVLNAMGITADDNGADIMIDTDLLSSISIEDTHERIYLEKKLKTKKRKRINITSDYEERNNLLWNFCAE